jgi:hypothetical protein
MQSALITYRDRTPLPAALVCRGMTAPPKKHWRASTAVDSHHHGKTMPAWWLSPIRSYGPFGQPPTACRLRSAASSLSG